MAVSNRPNDMRKAIEKLTDIHSDISKMLAVHEQRLNQHERAHDALGGEVEKRRLEIKEVANDVYKAINDKTTDIMKEIQKNAEKSVAQHTTLDNKISNLSRYIWIGVGASIGFSFIISAITLGINIFHAIKL